MSKRTCLAIGLATAFAACAAPAVAALQPNEIVIIAARGSRESEGLAKYYARVRGIPPANICLIDMPRGETCLRNTWTWAIRPEIHKWLVENDPQEKIKCLVTVWDVPLRIAPAKVDQSLRRYRTFLEGERSARLKTLTDILHAFERLAPEESLNADSSAQPLTTGDPGADADSLASSSTILTATADPAISTMPDVEPNDPAGPASSTPAPPPISERVRMQQHLEAALQKAQARVAQLPIGEVKQRGQAQLQQLATIAGGLNIILPAIDQRLKLEANPDPTLRAEFDSIRGRLLGLAETRGLLEQMPPEINRDALILAILERAAGIIGSLGWLDQQIEIAKKNETGASFDSELSLVMWPDEYQLLRWQPNYLRPSYENSQLRAFNRTLMVARIDAPTLLLAKGLIDTAIAVEKNGLQGKVYIDARGLAKLEDVNQQHGSYSDFDRSLLITAKGIEQQTNLEVVLNDKPELFQAGQCPEAALYCGWYSLAKYVDAFEWVPGAVAYHLASAEATTLRDPASQVWCKRLLEEGVCATIGPVYEPYLVAFPRPDEFFAQLLLGDATLVECYYHTKPFNSWMMTLIGDPLYRPFRYRAAAAADIGSPAF